MPFNGYRITIEKLTPNGHTMRQAEIVLTSDYTLIDDLSEWVKVEIDADASVVITDLDPTDIARFNFPNGPLNIPIDREKCPVSKSAHKPVTEMGVTTCEECGHIMTTVWRSP